MPDAKITDLAALTGAEAASTDAFPIADVDAAQTKKITLAELVDALAANGLIADADGYASPAMGRPKSATVTYVGIPGEVIRERTAVTIPANYDCVEQILVEAQPITITDWLMEVTTGPSGDATFRVGIYAATNAWQPTGDPLYDSGPVTVLSGATGIYSATGLALSLPPGRYVKIINSSKDMVQRSVRCGRFVPINPALGASPLPGLLVVNRAHAAFPAGGTPWNATSGSSAFPQHHVIFLGWTP